MTHRHRITGTILATAISMAAVLGSVTGCGPGYSSGYYHRAPVVVHRHIVEHHNYYHR